MPGSSIPAHAHLFTKYYTVVILETAPQGQKNPIIKELIGLCECKTQFKIQYKFQKDSVKHGFKFKEQIA